MRSSVAVYNSHEDAIKAVNLLKELDFPLKGVSIIGRVEVEDDGMHIKSNIPIIAAPLLIGTIVGTILGLLTGVGIFAIPGFGMLMGAGGLVGALGGFDVGLVAGGIGSVLVELGIEDEYVLKYDEYLRDGKFLVFVQGTEQEINRAKSILHNEQFENLFL